MKQLTLGALAYAQDYDERTMMHYIIGPGWVPFLRPYDTLSPYVKNTQIWICPSSGVIIGTQRCNFGRVHIPANSICSYTLGQYKVITDTIVFFDEDRYVTCADVGSTTACSGTCNGPGRANFVHNDGLNVSFLDGHAKWLPKQVLMGNLTTYRRQL